MSSHASPSKKKGVRYLSTKSRKNLDSYLVDKYGSICQWCFLEIDFNLRDSSPKSWSRDHIIERSEGGTNCKDNFQPMHSECNIDKGMFKQLGIRKIYPRNRLV